MKRPFSPPRRTPAFSMIEVVLALGLVSFALIGMVGLFGVGLKNSRESPDYIQAGNLAASLLSTWGTTNGADFPLPALTNVTSVLSNSTPVAISIRGTTLTNGLPNSDSYNLQYRISPGSTSHLVNVYLLLWWPIGAPTPHPGSYYEIATEVMTP